MVVVVVAGRGLVVVTPLPPSGVWGGVGKTGHGAVLTMVPRHAKEWR